MTKDELKALRDENSRLRAQLAVFNPEVPAKSVTPARGSANRAKASTPTSAPDAANPVTRTTWVGPPIAQRDVDGVQRTFYDGVSHNGQVFRAGECARVISDRDEPYLARAASFYEENGVRYVDCIWYWLPEETHGGRVSSDLRHEVFLCHARDRNEIESLLGPAEVVTEDEYKARTADGTAHPQLFFCKKWYDMESRSRRPLHSAQTAVITDRLPTLLDKHDDQTRILRLVLAELQLASIQQHKEGALELARNQFKASQKELAVVKTELQNTRQKVQRLEADLQWYSSRLPQKWPKGVRYTHTNDWSAVDPSIRARVCCGVIDGSEIRFLEKNSDHPAAGQYGLFASKEWEPNTILGEYNGVIVVSRLRKQLVNKRYLMSLHKDINRDISVDVDAEQAGNETRFINDFRGIGPAPNVQFEARTFGGSKRIIVRAVRKIRKGEEFLVDYGSKYWKAKEKSEEEVDELLGNGVDQPPPKRLRLQHDGAAYKFMDSDAVPLVSHGKKKSQLAASAKPKRDTYLSKTRKMRPASLPNGSSSHGLANGHANGVIANGVVIKTEPGLETPVPPSRDDDGLPALYAPQSAEADGNFAAAPTEQTAQSRRRSYSLREPGSGLYSILSTSRVSPAPKRPQMPAAATSAVSTSLTHVLGGLSAPSKQAAPAASSASGKIRKRRPFGKRSTKAKAKAKAARNAAAAVAADVTDGSASGVANGH